MSTTSHLPADQNNPPTNVFGIAPAQVIKTDIAQSPISENHCGNCESHPASNIETEQGRDQDHKLRLEARQARLRRQIPVNPYRMADGMGISTALALRDLLGCSLDAGVSGSSLFLIHFNDASEDDIVAVIKLRNEAYVLPENDYHRRMREANERHQ
jgi:hypothetical protein